MFMMKAAHENFKGRTRNKLFSLVEWYDRQLRLVEDQADRYLKDNDPCVYIYGDKGKAIISERFETDAQAENYYDKINKQLLSGQDFIVCGNETIDRRAIKSFKIVPAKKVTEQDKEKYIKANMQEAMRECAVYIPFPDEYLGNGIWQKDELWHK